MFPQILQMSLAPYTNTRAIRGSKTGKKIAIPLIIGSSHLFKNCFFHNMCLQSVDISCNSVTSG